MQLNAAIRAEMRQQGSLGTKTYQGSILISRGTTQADTKQTGAYRVGDVVQYRKGNKEVGVQANEYATVIDRNTDANRVTVKTKDHRLITYDPARTSGVNLCESRPQEFLAGKRIQFTGKDKKLGTHTRDMATIRSLDKNGNAEVLLDRNGKVLKFNLEQHRHLDHGYTMASHSANRKPWSASSFKSTALILDCGACSMKCLPMSPPAGRSMIFRFSRIGLRNCSAC